MFHSDQPINTKEYDCLNRTEFSKQLAKAILSYTKNDNFTISLCGKWGSGKTSILNMVTEEIGELTKSIPESQKPVIVKFNPWNYSECSQLIKQFFITIQTKLELFDGNEALSAVGNALQKYSSVLEYSAYIPVVGQYLAPIKEMVTGVGEHLTEIADENNNIEKQKQKVIEALRKQNQKFIIIMDDIDRLNNTQIQAIFQLVNSLAGFPNMIYLLSFDREVVARALQEEQNCDGEEYLEKIIQVPFEVPEANKDLVNEAFINRFADIIFDEDNQNMNFDNEYWSVVFSCCISIFINSIRDVNRVINTFEFKYGLMRNEINSIDLLALTTLQVCAPTIYRWIYNNANGLTGSIESAGSITGAEQKENKENYMEIFRAIYPENPNLMMNIIQTLFPKFSWKTGGYTRNRDSDEELRYKDKIASAERIMRYFNLSLEEIVISKKQIHDTVYIYTKNQLEDYFSQLLQNGNLIDYLQELLAFISKIPQDRKNFFVDALIEIQTLDDAYERKSMFLPIPALKCFNVVLELFKQDSMENNVSLLSNLIDISNVKRLTIICRIIEEIEAAYGRLGNYQNSSYQFITVSDLKLLESEILEKIKVFAVTENFFDCKEVEAVFKLWRLLEKETLDTYIVKMLQQPVNVPKYLSLYVGTWTSGKTNGWSFERETFTEYINKEDAYKKIVSLKNTAEFSSLHHNFKEITIAFYLWFSQESIDRHEVDKEHVNVVIPLWECLYN